MQKEVLEQVRKEYQKIKKEHLSLSKDYKEKHIIDLAYNNVPYPNLNKEFFSNHIMVYMGSYIFDRQNGHNDYITSDDNPNICYKKYIDLETHKNYDIEIDRCTEFEDIFTILYFTINIICEQEYRHAFFTLQDYFKRQIITRSQEDVIDDLKILYGKKSYTKTKWILPF